MALIIDLETHAGPDAVADAALALAAVYSEDSRPVPASYSGKKAEDWRENDRRKFAAERRAEADAILKASAFNARTGRIVAIGTYNDLAPADERVNVYVAGGDTSEADIIRSALLDIYANAPIVTFNGLSFDLPYLHLRAALLGLKIPYSPAALMKRYTTTHHVDLFAVLSNWGRAEKGDTLHGWCKAFGIEVTDQTTGADVAAMVERGDYEGIAAHCESDIRITAALYTRCLHANLF